MTAEEMVSQLSPLEIAEQLQTTRRQVKRLQKKLDSLGGFGADPEDSYQLLQLREAIDDEGIWPDQKTEDDGDYEAAVRFMASEIRKLRSRIRGSD